VGGVGCGRACFSNFRRNFRTHLPHQSGEWPVIEDSGGAVDAATGASSALPPRRRTTSPRPHLRMYDGLNLIGRVEAVQNCVKEKR
jgi:hypothetical protein